MFATYVVPGTESQILTPTTLLRGCSVAYLSFVFRFLGFYYMIMKPKKYRGY